MYTIRNLVTAAIACLLASAATANEPARILTLQRHLPRGGSPDPPRNGENGLSSAVGQETHRARCALRVAGGYR